MSFRGRNVELDFSGIKLCGRHEELSQLQNAFQHVTSNASLREHGVTPEGSQVFLIEGASGSGKSALVTAFRKFVVDQNHIFSWGKFEENRGAVTEPFSAFAECISNLFDTLYRKFPTWMDEMDDEASSHARIVAVILPHRFHRLLRATSIKDDQSSISYGAQHGLEFKSQWGFDRLRLAVKGLIHSLCESFPVVLALEDLQWADTESLTLLRTLISDKHDKHFFFVGTTRSDGKRSSTHALTSVKVDLLRDEKDVMTDQLRTIHLGDLSLYGVTEIVSSLLGKDPMDTQPLAEVVHRKTGGNASFVVQFLRLLYERRLIDFSLSTYRWEWDLDRIAAETVLADNVIDIVAGKILAMPKGLQVALTRAAFLGPSRFDAEILLQTISAQEKKDAVGRDDGEAFCNAATVLEDTLALGVKEGLLEKLRLPRIYKFSHDRIKESAYALVPDGNARKHLHLYIGRKLRELIDSKAAGSGTQVEDRLFLLAVRQMNLGSDFLENEEKKVELARLNSEAAEMAFEMSSFVSAGEYLQAGLSLLNTATKWDKDYELTLKVTTALAHERLCCGKMDVVRHLVDDVLQHAKSLKDKLGVYRSMILCLFQEGDTAGARDLTLRVLDQLGIRIPRRFLKLNIVGLMLLTRRRLRYYSHDDIMAFPENVDESTMLAAAFVALLSEMSLLSANNEYLFLSVLEAIRIAINGSKNDWTAMALAASGLIFAFTGEIDAAYRYGNLALRMTDKGTNSSQDGRAIIVTYLFVFHWKKPYHDCLEAMLRAYKIALNAGDIEYLFFSILGYSVTYYQCGLQLDPIAKDMRRFRDLLEDYGQTYYLSVFQTQMQFILNLMYTCKDPTILTGEAMNQEECLQLWSKTPNPRAMCHLTLNRMYLAYFFDDLPLAEKMASELCHPLEFGPVPWLALRFFFEGLICFGLAKSACRRRRYQRRGVRFLRKLEKFVRGGNVNCHHMMLLLRAEYIALTSQSEPGMVQRAYGDAITAAGKLGFMHHQAIGNERAGVYFLEQQNDKAWASTYLSRARALFELWGAQAKVRHMEAKYKELAIQPANSNVKSSVIMSRTRFDEMPVDSGSIDLYM